MSQLSRKIQSIRTPTEAGYTIIESLIAMVVVAILLSAVAPMIALSVGTRVQAKRVGMATEAAKAYIDAVKSETIEPPQPDKNQKPEAQAAPATGSLTCEAFEVCTAPSGSLYCVDFDDDGECTTDSLADMIVQPSTYNASSDQLEDGYLLGVRVYRASAFKSGTLKTESPSTYVTNAIGDPEAPLVQMTTAVNPKSNSFQKIRERVNN